MSVEEQYTARLEQLLEDLAPAGADTWVHNPNESVNGLWTAGYIDDWTNPGLGWIESHGCPETLIRTLRKERERRHQHENTNEQ